MDNGAYIAVFHLSTQQGIQVGKLGCFEFQAGVYLYTGSAQRNRDARLERHARQEKPLRWHIDYLSIHTQMLGAIVVPGPREQECALAAALGGLYELVIPRFGASDCRCPGHLFFAQAF